MNICFQVKYFDGYDHMETHYNHGNPEPTQNTRKEIWTAPVGGLNRVTVTDWSPDKSFWETNSNPHITDLVAPMCGHNK